eukprot:9311244-Alexandrium_andersonii.AAC.1
MTPPPIYPGWRPSTFPPGWVAVPHFLPPPPPSQPFLRSVLPTLRQPTWPAEGRLPPTHPPSHTPHPTPRSNFQKAPL